MKKTRFFRIFRGSVRPFIAILGQKRGVQSLFLSRNLPEACPFLGNPDFTLRTLGGHLSHFPRKKWSIGARIGKSRIFRKSGISWHLGRDPGRKMTSPDTKIWHFLADFLGFPGNPGKSRKSWDFLGFFRISGISGEIPGFPGF